MSPRASTKRDLYYMAGNRAVSAKAASSRCLASKITSASATRAREPSTPIFEKRGLQRLGELSSDRLHLESQRIGGAFYLP